jgi:DNA-binding transcriptional ArsR family regulator
MTIERPANLGYAGGVIDEVTEPAAEDFELPRVLAALADPHRLAAVRFVARQGESWCSQVIQEAGLGTSKSTFSHHLRILREAGIITKRIQGARGYMRLRKNDLDRRFPGLIDSILSADSQPVS